MRRMMTILTAAALLALAPAALAGRNGGRNTREMGSQQRQQTLERNKRQAEAQHKRSTQGSRPNAQAQLRQGQNPQQRQSQQRQTQQRQAQQRLRPAAQAQEAKPGLVKQQPGSCLSPTQQQNVQQLQSDLLAIKQGSQVTPEQKDALKKDLMAMADGATKPDPAAVQSLSSGLSQAMADGQFSYKEKVDLTQDVQQVMNSANIPKEEVEKALKDAQLILESSGVSKADAETIMTDLKAIAAEGQKNAQAAAGAAQAQSK